MYFWNFKCSNFEIDILEKLHMLWFKESANIVEHVCLNACVRVYMVLLSEQFFELWFTMNLGVIQTRINNNAHFVWACKLFKAAVKVRPDEGEGFLWLHLSVVVKREQVRAGLYVDLHLTWFWEKGKSGFSDINDAIQHFLMFIVYKWSQTRPYASNLKLFWLIYRHHIQLLRNLPHVPPRYKLVFKWKFNLLKDMF